MMRSMFSGVSGLKVHQTRMDVIGNNIANVNTVGYKSQRVTFSDVFSQTLSSATAASDDTGRGGINAMQVGLGVNISSIDMLMTQGASQRTDNPFDLMIDGDGFIVVGDAKGQYFTRDGALRLDDVGNLVIANGMKVQGWPSVKNAETGKYEIQAQEAGDINLFKSDIQSSSPEATTKAQISGNLCSTNKDGYESSIAFYDSQGNYYTVPVKFEKNTTTADDPNDWTLKIVTDDDGNNATDASGKKYKLPISLSASDFKFDADGNLTAPVADTTTKKATISLEFTDTSAVTGTTFGKAPATAGGNNSITVDVTGLTQYATKDSVTGKSTDGNAAGSLTGYAVGKDGVVTATYSNGDIRDVAQVVLAEFDNPAGLEKIGDNLYSATTNSGEFDGIGTAGTFLTGVLEMSNVDLSSEFTDMIITQRGFQANSRIITVSDEMLQELTNLKR